MSTRPTDPADRLPLPPPAPPEHVGTEPAPTADVAPVVGPNGSDPERGPGPAPATGRVATRDPRPGDLTPSWRFLLGAAWGLAFFAYAAIWNASVQIGIGTWWIGPRAQPTNIVVKLLPFLLCLAVLVCVVYNVAHLVPISALASGLAAVGAIPDFSRSVGLGVAEMVVAGLLAVVTATALTGRYRAVPTAPPPTLVVTDAPTGPPAFPASPD